jgi:putative ABC transport system permease protein
MSFGTTTLLARKSIRARLGRTIAIAISIVAGVAFVVGSFVLADSLKRTFDDLFAQINEGIDLEVRSSIAFGDTATSTRDPVPVELADTVSTVEGVGRVEPFIQRYAQLVDDDGDAITTQGAPTLGLSWTGPDQSFSGLTLKEGAAPSGSDEVAVDKATADREDIEVGQQIEVITDVGTDRYTVAGLVGLGDADGFAGATLAVWDLDTATQVLGSTGFVDAIDIQVSEGADPETVRQGVTDVLPERTEVVTGEQVAEEAADNVNQFISIFGTGLLIFAVITAFVSAFIINNVFAITIGQRLRELALMRAVGASGRQVRRMIVGEALVMSIIATLIGIVAGIGVARLLISLFNAAGAGFPDTGTVLATRTVIVAFAVGVGITLLSVAVPARRAAKIPPVAAMRPELGFATINARRLVMGTVMLVIGAVLFLIGLFVRPGGTIGLTVLAGVGGLLLFLGTASVSSTVARPVTRALGWPIAKLFGTPGALARDNAGRSPRRTAASAAALMIGVAMVSAAAVFAASIRDTFTSTLERAVRADYIVTDESFQGLPPTVSETLAGLPELSAVSAIRGTSALVDGDEKAIGAADPATLGELLDLDMQEGGFEGLESGGVLVHEDPAEDLDLAVGDTVPVTFQNGVEQDLTVVGVYADASVAGNWLISISTLEEVTTSPPRDFFVVGKLAEGVDPAAGDAAVRAATEQFPQAKVQTNAEFREQQEDQIDQLLQIISALLAFAILIAVMGISITLALSVFERTREIGLLRAVGMSRRQTRRTVRWEAVIVSLFGAVVGIVLGSLLGVALSLAVPDTIIDRVSFSPATTITILVGAVLAGLFAALYPARKASKMNVLEAIATE